MNFFRVEDLMVELQDYSVVDLDCSLLDALRLLERTKYAGELTGHPHRAVLVRDKDGWVVGKLSHWAVLRALIPSFSRREENSESAAGEALADFVAHLRRSLSGEPPSLEFMRREARRIKVRDAMVPAIESIDAQSRIEVAIQCMAAKRVQSLLVVKQGRVVGVLRLSDLFEIVSEYLRQGDESGQAKAAAPGSDLERSQP